MTESTRKLFGDGVLESVPKADFLELVTLWADELGITPPELADYFAVHLANWLTTPKGRDWQADRALERWDEEMQRRAVA